jgi:uncharacterized Zn ribbon protein
MWGGNKMNCTSCNQECFENQSPEIVFRDKENCICEECSIDYEEVNEKIQLREDLVVEFQNGSKIKCIPSNNTVRSRIKR